MNSIPALGIHAQPKIRHDHCARHGNFESRCFIRDVWSQCPECDDEQIKQEKARDEARQRDARRQVCKKALGEAGIPDRFLDRSLKSFKAEDPRQASALDFANRYANGFDDVLNTGKSAIFTGKPGTGKTHLACGIGLQIIERDARTVLFTTTLRALRRVKDTWNKKSNESESEAIHALASPDLLILDEVGVQFGTETEKRILFDILNERYEKRRPTLLLSNLTILEVADYLGERVMDRLREDGGEVVVFDWSSWRSR